MSSNQNKRVTSITKKLGKDMKRRKLRAYRLCRWLLVVACLVIYVLTAEKYTCGILSSGNNRYLIINSDAVDSIETGCREAVSQKSAAARTRLGRRLFDLATAIDYLSGNTNMLDRIVTYYSISYVDTNVVEYITVEADGSVHIEVPDDYTPNLERHIDFELPLLHELYAGLLCSIVLAITARIMCSIAVIGDRSVIKRRLKPIADIAVKADEITRLEFDESKYHHLEEKIAGLNPEDTLPVTQGDKDLESLEQAINNLLMRMRESNMQQARFVNDASHELRTPIAVIEGYANMLARWGREDEKVLDESIAAIQHESSHMKYLVEQLLFLARGDSGKTVLKLEDISLTDMMREIYEESLMIDEGHVYRFVSREGEDVRLNCDPALIKQAVRILVDNAVKYTGDKEEITLSVGMNDEGRPYLGVEDAGIGMSEDDVMHMFERFYRSDEVRSYKGTGLGLSIAKWIVDKHNGHFEVISREDIGTRIRVIL